jgi:MFS superfamily sulfate permease-like transporter
LALLIPEGMAYAELAGLPPQTAFYAAPIGLLLYAIFCTSRQLMVAVSAVIATMSAAVAPLAALILGTIIAGYFQLSTTHNVSVVGDIPIGMPTPMFPLVPLETLPFLIGGMAGIVFGDNHDIPAFRWHDKDEQKLFVSGKGESLLDARSASARISIKNC